MEEDHLPTVQRRVAEPECTIAKYMPCHKKNLAIEGLIRTPPADSAHIDLYPAVLGARELKHNCGPVSVLKANKLRVGS